VKRSKEKEWRKVGGLKGKEEKEKMGWMGREKLVPFMGVKTGDFLITKCLGTEPAVRAQTRVGGYSPSRR